MKCSFPCFRNQIAEFLMDFITYRWCPEIKGIGLLYSYHIDITYRWRSIVLGAKM